MASGLSSAVGFKNGTDGGLQVAINALKSVSKPHRFLDINPAGEAAVIKTAGKPLAQGCVAARRPELRFGAREAVRGRTRGPPVSRRASWWTAHTELQQAGGDLQPLVMDNVRPNQGAGRQSASIRRPDGGKQYRPRQPAGIRKAERLTFSTAYPSPTAASTGTPPKPPFAICATSSRKCCLPGAPELPVAIGPALISKPRAGGPSCSNR